MGARFTGLPNFNDDGVGLFNFFVRRILYAIPLLILVSVIMYAIMHLAPGGPLAMLAINPKVRPEDLARLTASLGLDKPWYIQYFKWFFAYIRGDWGMSFQTHRPVFVMIMERLPNTLQLMGVSMIFALALAVPIGIYSAIRQYTWFDNLATTFSYIGYSMPIFWFGLMLQLFFAYYLYDWTGAHIFYSANMYSVGQSSNILNRLQHLTLPVMTLSIASIAGWSRYQRSSMLEIINSDYLRTARAKGLPESKVILKHALRNAIIPLITVLTLDISALFSGAVVTETVFGWPGMGRLFYDAVNKRDYPVVMGCVMLFSVMVIFFNLIADVLYGMFDPRIRYD